MSIRLIEYLLINILNGVKRRREQRQSCQPAQNIAVPPEFAVLGHLIREEKSSLGEQTMRRLSDAGVVALSPEARMRHLYLLGATGTGKTNLLLRLIESDIQNQRAFCVVDLRGDLVDRILKRLSVAAAPDLWRQRLLLLDLRDSESAVGFNPLVCEGDAYTRALLMLSVIKKQSDSWGVQLEDTLRYSFMALSEAGWSLLEVRPLLTNAAFREQVMASVQDSQVRSFFEEFGQLSGAERSSRSSAALNKLSPLLSVPALRQMFGQRQGFSFGTLLDTQPSMIILVSLGVDRLHDAARLAGGLLISSFQSAIMSRVDQPEAERVPVHLYVDEFECMASDKFEEIVAEGRRFRVGLTLSHQNLSQLPLNLRHVIRNNVHTQVYFQTGAVDAGELAKEVGHGIGSADIRAGLMSHGVGEAFLVRRGQDAARMRTLRSDDPAVNNQRIQALRAASFATYARPRGEVEQELRERDDEFRNLNAAQPGQSAGAKVRGGTHVYHIRHDKREHFGPDMKNDDASNSGNGGVHDSVADAQPAIRPVTRPTLKPEEAGRRKAGEKAVGKSAKAAKKRSAPKAQGEDKSGGEPDNSDGDRASENPANAAQ
jgi:hypothetical protein